MKTLTLFHHNDQLCLGLPDEPDAGVLSVDFFDPAIQHRIKKPLSAESVVKAMGTRPTAAGPHPLNQNPGVTDPGSHLIDATAGLGLDAFILACAGWQVTMLEQSPEVHALLQDGMNRALTKADAEGNHHMAAALLRMYLMPACNSLEALPGLPAAAVIYMDPMFPEREKTARVKKNRYLLQQLHGEEAQGDRLLSIALPLARKIVVKRPQHAHPLEHLKPSGSINGKTARFDIYAGKQQL